MTVQALKRKKQELLASQVSRIASDTNENLLRVNLSKFFTDLEHDIQSALLEYWNDHMLLQGQVNLILASIHEKHQEYYELIMKHKLQEFHRAEKLGERLVKRQEQSAMKAAKPVRFTTNKDNLFGTLQYSEDRLAEHTFTASQNTLNRVDSNINEILLDGYKSGVGINEVSRQITERFDQLRTWEAKRIARTEIHTAQNMGVMNSYDQLGVEYTQWIAASDDRTRDSHVEVDGEIIPMGGKYSNGLEYPGDMSGPIEEWINCRCSNAPFVVPYGYIAPSFSPFREDDLVPIGNVRTADEILQPTEPQPIDTLPETSNSMLQGKYETYTEVDNVSKSNVTVYKYENGFELAINENAILTHEEVVSHINSLPEPLRNLPELKRINIKDWQSANAGGEYRVAFHDINVYAHSNSTKIDKLDTLTHELAHAKDFNGTFANNLSLKEIYEKIFKNDNKLYTFIKSNGRKKTPKKFPTDYAGRSYLKYAKDFKKRLKIWEKGSKTVPKPTDKSFTEDFAESTKLYLNPAKHEQFVKDFPNRAEYLESIYGKPKFNKNSPLYKALKEEGLI